MDMISDNRREDRILYLSRQIVEQICSEIDTVALIREMFALHGTGQTILPDEAYLTWVNSCGERVRSLNMPGYLGGGLKVAGTKIINGNIANPTRGLPRASGLTMLFDEVSVRILCIMEGAYISSLRTASVTVLAAETLRGPAVSDVAIIGAGVQAQAHIELLAKRRAAFPELRCIHIFDLHPARVELLQQQLAHFLDPNGIQLRIASSAEEAIRSAQLIVPVTTTTTGYISYTWLQPGSILSNVSLDDVLPDVVLQADKVIVDDWDLVKNDAHRLIGRMYRNGQVIGPDDPAPLDHDYRRIDAQLGDIIAGRKAGRQHVDERILVNPFGLSLEDVALASQVYQIASARKAGIELER